MLGLLGGGVSLLAGWGLQQTNMGTTGLVAAQLGIGVVGGLLLSLASAPAGAGLAGGSAALGIGLLLNAPSSPKGSSVRSGRVPPEDVRLTRRRSPLGEFDEEDLLSLGAITALLGEADDEEELGAILEGVEDDDELGAILEGYEDDDELGEEEEEEVYT